MKLSKKLNLYDNIFLHIYLIVILWIFISFFSSENSNFDEIFLISGALLI